METTAPPARTMRKEISPGMFLTRKEDARDEYAVVYTLRNDTDAAVYFTMDFWGSKRGSGRSATLQRAGTISHRAASCSS